MTSKSLPATLLEDKVEQYHGPGVYDTGQFFVAVQGGTTLRRWTNDTVHVTVGPGEAFVILPESRLDAEPARVECSRLITPASNYEFQCQGRGDANPALDTSVETVSGELRCAPTPKE